jgi:glycosyltransferase involved in cell wall biosynthesis
MDIVSKVKALESLTVFFPVYNEEESIPLLIDSASKIIPKFAKDYELIIINDGSTDQSEKIAKSLTAGKNHWRLISHPKNLGYGEVLKTGIREAKKDWLFFTDGDMQFDLEELANFLSYTTDFQVIIGYRKKRAEGLSRSINARLFKIYIDLLFRLHVKDIDCAFKLIKTDLLKNLTLNSGSAFTSSEILYRLKKQKIKFKELPVNHYPRKYGQATGANFQVIIKACYEALQVYLNTKFPQLQKHD